MSYHSLSFIFIELTDFSCLFCHFYVLVSYVILFILYSNYVNAYMTMPSAKHLDYEPKQINVTNY